QIDIVDVQTLLPFDLRGAIAESVKKTNRVLFLDEDCPGGGTAYMMQEVLERQGAYEWLDVAPRTLSGEAHRPAYGADGDYFSNAGSHRRASRLYRDNENAAVDTKTVAAHQPSVQGHVLPRKTDVAAANLAVLDQAPGKVVRGIDAHRETNALSGRNNRRVHSH